MWVAAWTASVASLDRLWRAARTVTSYKDISTSESSEDDFEDGLDFNVPNPEEDLVEGIRRRYSNEARVREAERQLNRSLVAERDERDEPREHFSPVQVRFPVNAPALRPPVSPPVMAIFEDENGIDEANALTEAIRRLERYEWNQDDLLFYFGQIEIKMAAAGVKKQFTKFQALSSSLPKHVMEAVKPLLRKTEAEYTANNSYKLLKTEIIRIFGPKPGAAVERALARVMVGPPSQLARELVNDICDTNMDCSNCMAVVEALWRRHLSASVKAGLAKYKLSKDNFKEVTELADAIHDSNAPAVSVAAVAAVTAGGAAAAAPPSSLNETQPGLQYPVPEVNAVQSGRGNSRGGGRGQRGWRGNRGGRGGRGGNQRGGGSQQSGQRGTRHPDIPPGEWSGCSNHYRFGKTAYFCSEPASCPWKDIYITRPSK